VKDAGADLELRLVRYFTVLAEHLNFSRAAAELHVAQPALSRQIRRLEHNLGVSFLDRTPQGALLTEAGKAFLPEAHALLRAARRATLTARAYTPAGRIVIGYVEDLVITPAVRELRRRHPDADIGTRHLGCHEEGAFTDGQVDVLVARAPLLVPTDGLRTTVLYEEPRMLVLPADHPLAGRSPSGWRISHPASRSSVPTAVPGRSSRQTRTGRAIPARCRPDRSSRVSRTGWSSSRPDRRSRYCRSGTGAARCVPT